MKKKISFVYPPSHSINRLDNLQQPIKNLVFVNYLPPNDLLYLAGVAELLNYEAKVFDYSLGGNFIADLKSFKPDYLLINVSIPSFELDMNFIEAIKSQFPQITIIAKGTPFLTNGKNVLSNHKYIDLIIVGESEETLKEILEEKPYQDILGLVYKDKLTPKFTGHRQFINDLSSLPFPARHLIDNNLYKSIYDNKPFILINVSRGCPYNCSFCLATNVSGSSVRVRTPENIILELKNCINNYKILNFIFDADNFNYDKSWVIDLCNKIIASNLKITWSANVMPKNLDENLLTLMYKAGCRFLNLGVESSSQHILDEIGKKTTVFEIKSCFNMIKKSKIKSCASLIFGLPFDDEKSIKQTIDFIIKLNPDFANFYSATPFKPTKLYQYALENNLFDNNYSYKYAYYYPIIKTHFISRPKIMELQKLAVKKFYLRPKYIFKMLIKTKSYSEFKRYFKIFKNIYFIN